MEDLDALPVNQVMLKKNPDIMKTIKMVSDIACKPSHAKESRHHEDN